MSHQCSAKKNRWKEEVLKENNSKKKSKSQKMKRSKSNDKSASQRGRSFTRKDEPTKRANSVGAEPPMAENISERDHTYT